MSEPHPASFQLYSLGGHTIYPSVVGKNREGRISHITFKQIDKCRKDELS